jgi:hypothetical protein
VFEDALLTEIGFPALDGAGKAPAVLTLAIAARRRRVEPGDGTKIEARSDAERAAFRPDNFRLTIDGLGTIDAKVSKVDAIDIKRSVVSRRAGSERDHELVPGKLEMPTLKLTLGEDRTTLATLAKDGKSSAKTGSLVYLNRTRQKELLSLTLSGLRIDRVSGATVEMYCDEITIKEWSA